MCTNFLASNNYTLQNGLCKPRLGRNEFDNRKRSRWKTDFHSVFLDPQTFVGSDESRDYCSTGALKTFSCLQTCTWILPVPGSGGTLAGFVH